MTDEAQRLRDLAQARHALAEAVHTVRGLNARVLELSRYPQDQYYSPSTQETLNVFVDGREEHPSIETQMAWIGAHADAVRLRNCFEKLCPCCGQQAEP